MARDYVEADRRIVLGFIEPHFMAGFSGGYKGVFPAVADIAAIMHYHRAAAIGHPHSTWGVLDGNPTQEQYPHERRAAAGRFLVNVTLNRERQITRFFCGDVMRGARGGLRVRASETAMVACRAALPDRRHDQQRLSARPESLSGGEGDARRDADRRGRTASSWPPRAATTAFPATATSASCCSTTRSPRALLDTILAPGFSVYDQWEAQLLRSSR